jgi:3-deoxy-D-arabino-heptulosonate 7-phosphate (DAHP) synthase
LNTRAPLEQRALLDDALVIVMRVFREAAYDGGLESLINDPHPTAAFASTKGRASHARC